MTLTTSARVMCTSRDDMTPCPETVFFFPFSPPNLFCSPRAASRSSARSRNTTTRIASPLAAAGGERCLVRCVQRDGGGGGGKTRVYCLFACRRPEMGRAAYFRFSAEQSAPGTMVAATVVDGSCVSGSPWPFRLNIFSPAAAVRGARPAARVRTYRGAWRAKRWLAPARALKLFLLSRLRLQTGTAENENSHRAIFILVGLIRRVMTLFGHFYNTRKKNDCIHKKKHAPL